MKYGHGDQPTRAGQNGILPDEATQNHDIIGINSPIYRGVIGDAGCGLGRFALIDGLMSYTAAGAGRSDAR